MIEGLEITDDGGVRLIALNRPASKNGLTDELNGGIIAALNTPSESACVKQLNIPVVNISGTLSKTPVPRVSLDNGMVGQLAAEHLLERGFETFAYFGLRDVAYSAVRQNAFDAVLKAAGARSVALLMPPTI